MYSFEDELACVGISMRLGGGEARTMVWWQCSGVKRRTR